MTDDDLIRRHHVTDGVASEAVYSGCMTYRYALTRIWDASARRVAFVLLNPSTADEKRNDPTVERCERRARAMGFGAFRVVNIFAFRATDPADLKCAAQPVGPDNDRAVLDACAWADLTIGGWGAHGDHNDRSTEMAALLQGNDVALHALGTTKAGHPRHPLYVAYATLPAPWSPEPDTPR